MSVDFTVRTMRHEDVDKCLEIWAQVDLTEAKQTVASSLEIEPDAFKVAELNETGEVIGMCAAPKSCNGETAFIGFYGVAPMYQNLGVGRELWSKTVGRLDPNLNKGLYGVPEMVEKYKKAGFILEDSISMLVYQTSPNDNKEDLNLESLCTINELNEDINLSIFDGSDEQLFSNLVRFDTEIQGFSREELLRGYLMNRDDNPLTVMVLGADSLPVGYGIIRNDNTSGGIIGPIYANNPSINEIILRELLTRFELPRGKIFTIMPLTSNQEAMDTLEKVGFIREHDCSRLFTKFIPKGNLSKIFYIHSPNFSIF